MPKKTTQTTDATVAPKSAKAATKSASSTKKATPKKEAPKAKKVTAKKPAATAQAVTPTATREGSKSATVLEMMRRPNGVTLTEIMTATGWQKHSVRGFISGAVGKKMGLKVESTRREDGEREYSIS